MSDVGMVGNPLSRGTNDLSTDGHKEGLVDYKGICIAFGYRKELAA